MHSDRIDMYLIANARYFPASKMPLLREQLSFVPDEKFMMLQSINLKDPTTILLFSIFLGTWGVDRFMLGDTGMGVGKLLTLGGCSIWWLIDLFLVQDRAREVNFNNLIILINQIALVGHGRLQ